MTTRERILKEALDLFSISGFSSVSVRDISRAVGIKESSLYNHFTNKKDIFDSLLKEYSGRWEAIFSQVRLTGEDKKIVVDDRTVSMYRNMTPEQFKAVTSVVFDYYMTDDINVKFRKMLTIEQYRDPEIATIFRRTSFDDSLDFQAQLFQELINQGGFIKTDPYILALEFFSPIFLIFYKFDSDPDSLKAAKNLFERHIDHFNSTYGTKSKGGKNHEDYHN